MSLTGKLVRIGEKKIWLRGRNESKRHLLAGIGQKKIYHELDVHHS